jgi:hypothetical protein
VEIFGVCSSSVILPDIPVSLIKKVLVLDLVFHIDHFAQGLLNLTLSGFGGLPSREPHSLYDLVNSGRLSGKSIL